MTKPELRMRSSVAGAIATIASALLLWATCQPAASMPLDPAECQKLRTEHKEMVGTGIEAKLVKGPVWGLANLTAEELDGIKHFLSIEEQLQFRCPLVQLSEPQALKATRSGMPLPVRRPEPNANADKSAGIESGSTVSN